MLIQGPEPQASGATLLLPCLNCPLLLTTESCETHAGLPTTTLGSVCQALKRARSSKCQGAQRRQASGETHVQNIHPPVPMSVEDELPGRTVPGTSPATGCCSSRAQKTWHP